MAKKKAGAAVTPEASVAVDEAPAAAPAPAAPAPVAGAPTITLSDARKAQLQAMLGPDGQFLPNVAEDMAERGITAAEVAAAIKAGTAHRHF